MRLKNKYKLIAPVFFMVFLCLGAVIFKDYGISYDERVQRGIGGRALKYIFLGDKSLNNFSDKDYGPAFEMFLGAIEASLSLTANTRATYLMRHLVTFLLFYTAVIFFYRLSRYRFQGYGISLLGSLFLILSPRIFADAFYNSKDIAFLSMCIISIYTLIMFLDMMTLRRAFIHAFTCAVTIDIRIAGVIIPLLAVIFFTARTLMIRPLQKKNIVSFALYMFFLCFFVILFWPALWQSPLRNFANAFLSMSRFSRWQGEVLYLGNYVNSSALPWHYVPVWIIITTPVCYSIFFLTGCVYFARSFFGSHKYFRSSDRYDLIIMFWFFMPLLAVFVFKPVLYNAWRQLFFIYPAFLLIGLSGLINLFRSIKFKFHGLSHKAISMGIVLLSGINLINTAKFMARYHPFQNLYFNILAGKNMQDIKRRFEFDYWGLSYRRALEYILKNDPGKKIKIHTDDYAGKVNAYILSMEDSSRLAYVDDPDQANYFVGNYKLSSDEYQYKNEFYSIEINGAKIISVYKL